MAYRESSLGRKRRGRKRRWRGRSGERELSCARLIFVNRLFDVPPSQPHFNIPGFVKAIADSWCNDPGVWGLHLAGPHASRNGWTKVFFHIGHWDMQSRRLNATESMLARSTWYSCFLSFSSNFFRYRWEISARGTCRKLYKYAFKKIT